MTTPYRREYSFNGFQSSAPSDPLPASRLDNELINIETAIASLRAAIIAIDPAAGGGGTMALQDSDAVTITGGSIAGASVSVTATGASIARSLAARFAQMAFVEDFGAVGDGVANDTAAIQAAIDSGLRLSLQKGATYNIHSTLSIPSNTFIDFNGGKLVRKTTSATMEWLLKNSTAETTNNNTNIVLKNVWLEDDGTTGSRGNFLLMSGVDGLFIDGFKIRGSAGQNAGYGAWGTYITGDNIIIDSVDIDTESCGLYSSGMQFGYLSNFSMTNFTIRAGDDALAFHFPPSNYTWVGHDGASSNLFIGDGTVSSVESNGIRIGAWGAASGGTSTASNSVWKDVTFSDIQIGACGNYPIEIFDDRTTGELNSVINDNIAFSDIQIATQTGVRLINVYGNPDVTDSANRAQHNFGVVSFSNVRGSQYYATGQLVYAGGVDKLDFDGCYLNHALASSANSFDLYEITTLEIKSCNLTLNSSNIGINLHYIDNFLWNDNSLYDAGCFAAVQLVKNADMSLNLRMFGGYILNATRAIHPSGSGTIFDFIVSGTHISATTLTTITSSGGTYIFAPANYLQTKDANGMVTVGSLNRGAPVVKTADFSPAATENYLINDKSGSSCTVTMPSAASWTGREMTIVNRQAQTVVSSGSNIVPIAGGAAGTAILAATAGKWADLVSDGTNWLIVRSN